VAGKNGAKCRKCASNQWEVNGMCRSCGANQILSYKRSSYVCESKCGYKCGKQNGRNCVCGKNRFCSRWNWCGTSALHKSTSKQTLSNDYDNACSANNKKVCVTCGAGKVSENNRCKTCPTGTVVNNNACQSCCGNTIPNSRKTKCYKCPAGQIAKNYRCVQCTGNSIE